MNDGKNRRNSKKGVILNENLKVYFKKHKNVFPQNYNTQATVKQISHSKIYDKICYNINSYLYNSTLHGLNYVGDVRISYGERLCWLISFLIALGCAIYFIVNIYIKYTSSPMLISVNPIPIPMENIPFPAITICNMNLARRNESMSIFSNGSNSEKSTLENICRIEDESNNVQENNDTNRWEEIKKIILKISQPCDKMLHMCKWHLRKIECKDLFNFVATDEGLCCTFNMLPLHLILRNTERSDFDPSPDDYRHFIVDDWNPERGYSAGSVYDVFPFRSKGPGAHMGLRFLLDADVNNYYCLNSNSGGVKMVLHNPSEMPLVEDFGFMLPVGYEIRIVFKPIINDATPDIKPIALQKRMCYFNNEKFLKYYRVYSRPNCKMECLVNKTIERCGCVPYHYPKNNETRICHHVHDACSISVKESMDEIDSETDEGELCGCLPSCFRLDYIKAISYGQLANKSRPPEDYLYNKSMNYIRDNIVIADVYFEITEFSRFTKNELYGTSDLLASVGGLLGLFLGFSILSIVEIIYHLTLKLLCKSIRDRKRKKSTNKIIPVIPLNNKVKFKN